MKKDFICSACPRRCNKLRTEKSGEGYCKAGSLPVVSLTSVHRWEEPCISGERGSGTIFFEGCVLKCAFCQNYKISQKSYSGDKALTSYELADCFKELEEKGVHNINLVTPTHFIYPVIDALNIYKPKIPVVYNCGGYESVESLRLLDGLVDIYLPDFKYFSSEFALKYSKAPDYFNVALSAIEEMVRQTGAPTFDNEGMLASGTLVRHLVLPGCVDDSIKIMRVLSEKFGENILFSLMHQYYPAGNLEKFPELNRKLTKSEYETASDTLFTLNLDGYVQDEESADGCYTPDF